ncbi:putative xylanase [Mucinivorans hirudinis]|uniref:Putative xylanase n=1 Tax=Mucinivorans hirudinis TaxID=1433126 RepID=A0A060RBR7_9BACT|nr:putative xylanase [Mucinivorans hirudinis]
MKLKFSATTLLLLLSISVSAQSSKPLETLHVRGGLPNFYSKAINTKDSLTVVYFGGSITHAPGYREYSTQWLNQNICNGRIRSINAAIPGTGSDLGVFRLADDVLMHKPDLVFVEFAVNDRKTDSTTITNSMEGIVRQIKNQNINADICFVYTICDDSMLEFELKNELPVSIKQMEKVAQHYGIPTINYGVDVIRLLNADKLIFRAKADSTYGDKIIFTIDGVHPTIDQGHKVYEKTFIENFPKLNISKKRQPKGLPNALSAGNYENVHIYSPKVANNHGFRSANYKRDAKSFMKTFPDMIYSVSPKDSIVFNFKGTKIGVYDIIGPFGTNIAVSVDGGDFKNFARFDEWCSYTRVGFALFDDLEDKEHRVVIKIGDKVENKLATLGRRKPNIEYFEDIEQDCLYIGKILVVGQIK